MPKKAWLDYHTEYLPSRRDDAVHCDFDANRNIWINLARTLHEGFFVPGYTVGDVGYFLSKERQPFQTKNFQVLVSAYVEFENDYFKYYADGMVADAEVEESQRIKFGSFYIAGLCYCGMVDSQHTCHINLEGKVFSKIVPEFKLILDLTSSSVESSDSDDDVMES
ncbi:Hypothetical predicted protein [Cloeon dipterum]|uniref:Uncharacterized protein n=1 Tax=Cloeon dipterum TaxID=197152 RepID=A0A8S1DU60_9INSE|nr:Hypothetical predicted protein [Cloeon dipterum]